MGRTEPSVGRPPAAFRKQQRARKAKETLSKVIPALLASNGRARRGVQGAELLSGVSVAHGHPSGRHGEGQSSHGRKSKGKSKRSDKASAGDDEHEVAEPALATAVVVNQHRPEIQVMVTDTLTAAAALTRTKRPATIPKRASKVPNVAVLNMASLLRPGGGFTSGATSQEEFLCMRTTLLPSLRDEFYRLPEIGGVWSRDVLVFRDSTTEANDLPSRERYFVDVITAGMIRFPNVLTRTTYKNDEGTVTDQLKEEQVYASSADTRLVRSKMTAVLRALQSKGCKQVVLGAWGCGAYGNPVGEIARAWKETLMGTPGASSSHQKFNTGASDSWFGLTEVVFAIKQGKMAAEFSRAWGEGIELRDVDSEHSGHDDDDEDNGGEKDTAQSELRELSAKIEQLNAQVANAKTPALKNAFEAILQKLGTELDNRKKASLEVEDSSEASLGHDGEVESS